MTRNEEDFMTFSEYQAGACTTAIYPGHGDRSLTTIIYCTLGLVGEAGELAQKLKKCLRDQEGVITEEFKKALEKELGDCQWYVSQLATELNLDLTHIAIMNLDKLRSRKEKGTLQGSGDDR